jgi:hypothetical protein
MPTRSSTRVARVNALTQMNVADAPATPKNVRIIAANLANDTTLAWAANTEPDLAGYEVMWRATTDPAWTHVIPVGNFTTFAANGLSKDNVYFRIRAINKSGLGSPVAFPAPGTS